MKKEGIERETRGLNRMKKPLLDGSKGETKGRSHVRDENVGRREVHLV